MIFRKKQNSWYGVMIGWFPCLQDCLRTMTVDIVVSLNDLKWTKISYWPVRYCAQGESIVVLQPKSWLILPKPEVSLNDRESDDIVFPVNCTYPYDHFKSIVCDLRPWSLVFWTRNCGSHLSVLKSKITIINSDTKNSPFNLMMCCTSVIQKEYLNDEWV